jgi:WD40 repeat protein
VSDGTTSREIRPTSVSGVLKMTFAPDGRTLVLGGISSGGDGRGSVELWRLDGTEDTIFRLEGHSSYVADLAYSLDGTLLVSASGDNTIRLWDVASSRQCVRTFQGHTGPVRSISFTPHGNFLASGGYDRTIRLWSITSGHCIESLNKMCCLVRTVEFSRDGQILLTDEESDICLRIMDTCMLEELKKEHDDLMKVTTEQLKQALAENNIPFEPESTSLALVNLLVRDLDQNQRKGIITRYSNGAPSSSARL